MESKRRFKLYKSGKIWCCMAIAFMATTMGRVTAHADTMDDSQVNQTVITKLDSNEQNVIDDAKISPQQVSASVTTSSSNQVPNDTTTYNNNPAANYGNLDSHEMQVDQQTGQLTMHATGWQASGQSNDQSYRYAILYDNTANRELDRERVTPVERTDVQKAYPHVDNSLWSGFDVTFKLPSNIAGHSLSVVARYSTDAINGEGQHTDYWFSPVVLNKENRASLDGLETDAQGNIHVSGWHASNQALGKKYHYVIAYDQTTNCEIARQLVNYVNRPDVAQAYPVILNADWSGFNATFKLTSQYANDNIQFISRWTDDPAGNGNTVDYWFAPVHKQNRGNLDSWDLSSGHLQVSGWHANDASIYEPYHFLIVYDNTSGQQVASQLIENQSSADVAKVYGSDTRTAGDSRFNVDMGSLNLVAGHSYSLVSRYSNSASGNGGNGNYTDYWYPNETFDQTAYSIDNLSAKDGQINISGWFASDGAVGKNHPYIIFLINGREVARQAVTLSDRPDVAKAYPNLYNSLHSGYSVSFALPTNISGNLQFVLRFSDQVGGEGKHVDIWTKTYATNAGNFDTIAINSNSLTVTGWHATMNSTIKPYRYIIIVDADNGSEYGRWQVNGMSRPDVENAYPWIAGSDDAGFTLTVNNANFNHHNIKVIHRYTNDPAGNGDYVDYESGVLHIHSWYKEGNAVYHLNDSQQIDYVLNDALNICQRPDLPTGCEMTAVTMMLQYAGVNVSKEQVANVTPRSSNPYYGFVGNPYSNYGSGLWVAPSGIASVVQRYLGTVWNMTGCSLAQIKNQLINRHLVVVWQAYMHGFGTHAITLTGFDGSGFYYNDPWTGQKNVHITFGTFDWNWRDDPASRGALSY